MEILVVEDEAGIADFLALSGVLVIPPRCSWRCAGLGDPWGRPTPRPAFRQVDRQT
jgi:hypothetical protein